MKKRLLVLLTVISLLNLLSGCNNKTAEETTNQTSGADTSVITETTTEATTEQKTENSISPLYTVDKAYDNEEFLGAVVFIGYIEKPEELNSFLQSAVSACKLDDSLLDEKNYDLCSSTGDEYYLIIPKYENSEITVNSIELNNEGEFKKTGELITTLKPVLLKCNASDIIADSYVTIVSNDKATKFSPYISLENGNVVASDEIYIYPYAPTFNN